MNVTQNDRRIRLADSNVPIILVVEDDRDNLLLLSHILIFLKYNFVTATNARDALDLATNYKIDLVLLDLVLPDFNGFELIERFKKQKSTKNMTIVAISALVKTKERDRAFAAGCDEYLEKPYSIDDLTKKIRHYLPQSFFSPSLFRWLKFTSNSGCNQGKLFCS
ncbi:response regulator [Waterburya agarophytonicola K14]|uniref:Response regulator n=1 Tax=Waterburya agarophytonicola KI4 TaxID=2874699 RepID=A0A964BS35_9CYAN|nr:response regulator [Waterburya agarophytonicola]MCC0178698.1 response regulator [Waterburya agarophytonicola KI4]